MPHYCHVGEVRPGAGIAWVETSWGLGQLPQITYYGSREPRNKILIEIVPKVIEALMNKGSYNIIIEEAL